MTTVEIIKERRPSNRSIRHQDTDVVAVAVPYAEQGLRQKLKAVGGRWDPEQKVWRVNYRSEGDMAFSDVLTISATILGTLGGGAALVFALSSWLGKVWANRLMEADKANHARELKGLEAALLRDGVDRTRKIEALMHHYERQIEEFYGPLFNMVNQVFVANHIKWELLKVLRGDVAEKVRDYFHETYFIPLHDEIRTILRSKLYLIEGSEMPESFYLYLKHAAQERDQITLWKRYGIDTSFLQGEPWPEYFFADIRSGFELAMRNYEDCLNGLKALQR